MMEYFISDAEKEKISMMVRDHEGVHIIFFIQINHRSRMYRGGFQSREQTGAILLALIQPTQRSKKAMLDLFEVHLIDSLTIEWTILWCTCHGRMLWHTARGRARGCHGRLSGSMLLGAACTTGVRMSLTKCIAQNESLCHLQGVSTW